MSERVDDLEGRVGSLATDLGKLKTALDDETKERKDDKQAFQQQLGLLADLLTDNNTTTTGYTIEYLNDRER